jgi:RNA polymerase sigma-70 factor (ECF subfamily)
MAEVKPDSEETCRLLAQVESGDRAAFDGLLARHRDWLRRLVEFRGNQRLQVRVDASDVVQETQLETYQRLGDYLARRPMPFRLWLRKTLQQRLQMIQRKHVEATRRSVHREVRQTDSTSVAILPGLPGVDPTPSQQFAKDERATRVNEALSKLDDGDREIILMRTYESLSYSEISYVLEIEEAAARKRHGRALVRLHKLLAEGGLTESQI